MHYVRMQRMLYANLAVECLFIEIKYQEIAQCAIIFYKNAACNSHFKPRSHEA